MDKIKKIAWWLSVPPLVFTFWSFVAATVHFWDDLSYVLDNVTALWLDYVERMNHE
jgi:hypothetical protein